MIRCSSAVIHARGREASRMHELLHESENHPDCEVDNPLVDWLVKQILLQVHTR